MIPSVIKDFIEKYNLSGTFVVAFSGGYDSMCLLDVIYKLGYDVAACHLNHNWRGDESFQEAKKCEEFCKSRNIKFISETLSDAVEKNEAAAREARYEFFRKCAKRFHSDVVFTAHNFEDNAETVLYRIIKGTGICGLQGIAECRDVFYRPLLTVKREDIENYCKDNNLQPNVDSSNADIKYKRNLIRHKIIPLMCEINPKAADAVNSLSYIAKENCKEKEDIRELLIAHNIDYDRKKINDIYNFIEENRNSKSGKIYSLNSDLWLFVRQGKSEVIFKKEKLQFEVVINKVGEYKFDNHIFSIKEYDGEDVVFGDEFRVFVCLDNIDFTLRYRKNGDKIQPLGNVGTQKLKKYLNEKKIPNHKKDDVILLCKDSDVLWAAGLGLSNRIKVVEKPTHILSLREGNYEY